VCRGETGDRHAERRAGHIVETVSVAELDGSRVAAMLAADAQLDAGRVCGPALRLRFHQFADAVLVQRDEGILFV
jgi:hypothetical protein